jgi:hypothetical protein
MSGKMSLCGEVNVRNVSVDPLNRIDPLNIFGDVHLLYDILNSSARVIAVLPSFAKLSKIRRRAQLSVVDTARGTVSARARNSRTFQSRCRGSSRILLARDLRGDEERRDQFETSGNVH